LGGVLAQITAYKFGLRGETFNAFGAVSLGYKIPEGGAQVVNHVKASDPVSAASRHFGQVRQYASAQDVRTVGAHRMHHFTNLDSDGKPDRSTLANPEAPRLAQEYRLMFDKYRNDLHAARDAASNGFEVHGRGREAAGRLAGDALDLSGDSVRHTTQAGAQVSRAATLEAGAVVGGGVHAAGEVAAGARQIAGRLEAGVDQVQGQAQRHANATAADALRWVSKLAPMVEPWLEAEAKRLNQAGERAYQRNLAEAAEAERQAGRAASDLRNGMQARGQQAMEAAVRIGEVPASLLAGAGQQVDRTLDAAGQALEAMTARTPPAALEPVRPIVDLPAIQVRPEPELRPGTPAPAVTPAPEPPRPGQASHAPPGPPVTPDFRHPHHPLQGRYQQAMQALHTMEAQHNIPHTDKSERVAAAVTGATQLVPKFQIGHLELVAGTVIVHSRRDNFAEPPLSVRVDTNQALALTPEQHTAAWQAQAVPGSQPAVAQARLPAYAPIDSPPTTCATRSTRGMGCMPKPERRWRSSMRK
ncbi:MAG TPA: XVIPCD domain-containing protein, partial [Pseudoxanthomonas sp.]|nr:XVIPCD domain-containing protein [Pseudoxanthomonas sp.]